MKRITYLEPRVGIVKESLLIFHQNYSVEIFAPDKLYGLRQLKKEAFILYREVQFQTYNFCIN